MSKRDINRSVLERIASRPAIDTDPDNAAPETAAEIRSLAAGQPAKTWVGVQGAGLVSSLGAKLKALQAQVESGEIVLNLDPTRIRHSEHNTRDSRSMELTDPEFAELVESVRSGGINQPIQVRPVPVNESFDYEVVTGHRRHAAALLLNAEREGGFRVPALVAKGATSPAELVRLMYLENSVRKDMSPYEYGLLYVDALKMKEYPTQEALAKVMQTSHQSVSVHVTLANFPEALLRAFEDRRQIAVRWVQEIATALKERRDHVLEIARDMEKREPRLTADRVKSALVALPIKPDAERLERYEQTVRRADRKTVFAKLTRDGRSLRVRAGPNISSESVLKLTKLISDAILEAQRQEEGSDG